MTADYAAEWQASEIRVLELGTELWGAIDRVRTRQPDLAYEEVLDALMRVSTRCVMHLRSGDGNGEDPAR